MVAKILTALTLDLKERNNIIGNLSIRHLFSTLSCNIF